MEGPSSPRPPSAVVPVCPVHVLAPQHWDEWDRPEGRPGRPMPPRPMPPRGPPTPFSSLLVQCMVSHMPELSAACAATPAMQLAVGAKYATLWREEVETRLGGVDFMALLWIPYVAGCVVALAVGVGYFLWQRHRLQRRRGAVARAAQGGWSTGLFHCDVPSCLPSCCCPVFQSALNQAEVRVQGVGATGGGAPRAPRAEMEHMGLAHMAAQG